MQILECSVCNPSLPDDGKACANCHPLMTKIGTEQGKQEFYEYLMKKKRERQDAARGN